MDNNDIEGLNISNLLYKRWWSSGYKNEEKDILLKYNIHFMTQVLQKYKATYEKTLENDTNDFIDGINGIINYSKYNDKNIQNIGIFLSTSVSGYFNQFSIPIFTDDLVKLYRCYNDQKIMYSVINKLNISEEFKKYNLQIFPNYKPIDLRPTGIIEPSNSSCSIIVNYNNQNIPVSYNGNKILFLVDNFIDWKLLDKINLNTYLMRLKHFKL